MKLKMYAVFQKSKKKCKSNKKYLKRYFFKNN